MKMNETIFVMYFPVFKSFENVNQMSVRLIFVLTEWQCP
jgi:hypothetical protein